MVSKIRTLVHYLGSHNSWIGLRRMSKFVKIIVLYITALMSIFISLNKAFACDGNSFKIENLELFLLPNTEIRLDRTDTETKVFLINRENGSLVMSIQEKDKQQVIPRFDVELGNDIKSQILIQNKFCIFRDLKDVPFQGNVSIDGVVFTFDYIVKIMFLTESPLFKEFERFCSTEK